MQRLLEGRGLLEGGADFNVDTQRYSAFRGWPLFEARRLLEEVRHTNIYPHIYNINIYKHIYIYIYIYIQQGFSRKAHPKFLDIYLNILMTFVLEINQGK